MSSTPHRPRDSTYRSLSSRSPIGRHRKLRSLSEEEIVDFIGKLEDHTAVTSTSFYEHLTTSKNSPAVSTSLDATMMPLENNSSTCFPICAEKVFKNESKTDC